MAIGNPVIATAAIGLIPTIQGVKGNIAGQLANSSVMSSADQAGRSVGSRFGSTITSSLKGALKIGGVLTAAVAGVTLKGGFDRALGIEDARAKMGGLGHDTKTVEKIMGNALASVEGTAFGLDAAATTAAGAVAAGIKPGEQLEQTLKTVANTAAAAGTGMDEIGGIFNTVASVGAAYTGDINMIAQRGIPIWQSLGDTLGKSQAEVKKMATEGKIDFATFEAAAKDASGGVATAMGDTTRGSFANMMASVRKLGAMFATGILPLAKTTFQGIQGLLNAVKAKLEPFVSGFFERFGGSAQAGIQGFFDGLISRVESFDPTPVVNFFKEVQGGIRAFGAAWKYNDGEVTSSGFPGFMEKAAYWIRQLWDNLKAIDFSSFEGFAKSLTGFNLGDSTGALSGLGDGFKSITDAAPGLVSIGVQALGNALQFLSDHSDTVVKLLPYLVSGFVAYKVATQGLTAAVTAQRAADIATLPTQILRNVTATASAITRNQATAAELRLMAATNASAATTTRATVAERLRTIATKAGAIASRIAAVATRALGAAIRFATGPIGLIITGVTLLAGALYLFFTKTEVGKKLWATIWGAIKNAAAAVVDWFMGTALPFLQSAWQGIAAGALWLYNSAIVPAWNGIKTAISAVADWVVGTLVPWLKSAWTVIANTALWLYKNIIMPAWDGIRIAIAVAVTAVLVYIDLLKWYFSNVIAPVALWLYNSVIKPVWAGIQAAIGAVVNWMMNTAWPILQTAWNAIAGAAKWLYNSVILPVWNAIKTAIAAVVTWVQNVGWPALKLTINWIANAFKWLNNNVIQPVWSAIKTAINTVVAWLQNTAWPLISTVIGWLKMSFEGWKKLAQAVWDAVKSAINTVVGWFRDTAWPVVKGVLDKLKSGFTTMKDGVKAAWDAIKDKAIKPVVDWFSSTVKPKIDDFTGKVKDGFTKLKDGVLAAWDGIKDGLKKPINGVIGIYNDHIAGNFNKVATTLGLGEKYKLATMAEFATGGYTGPGSKYQPAGVVHADEFVIRKESQNSLARQAPGFLDALNTHGARALTDMGFGYAGGGKVLNGWQEIAAIPHKGVSVTSTVRRGARTAGTGSVSKHAQGLAVDFAGATDAMKSFFNFVRDNYSVSELIHTPMGGRQLSRGGIPKANFPAATANSHYNHVHVGGWGPDEKGASGSGTGEAGGSWWNPFDGLWGTIKDKVATAVGDGPIGGMVSKIAENTVGGVGEWVTGKIAAIGDFATTGVGYAAMSPIATAALLREGQAGPKRFASLMRRMGQESNYDPMAVNNWDSNAKAGNASKGLMQVIPTTFHAYRDKSLPNDIFNPLSNIVASIRYTLDRYGDLEKGWDRKGGYAGGGWTGPGSKYQPAGVVHADEHVIRKESRASIERARPGFLDRLNSFGAAALGGYANGGLVGYASGGKVSPTSSIGATKVTVLLDGLTGTSKQVTAAAGKLADGIVKVFNDRMKSAKTATVNKLSDSLSVLKKEASALKKSISATTSKSKKSTVAELTDELAALRKQKSTLSATAKEVSKVTKVVGKTAGGKLKTKTVTTATKDAVKAAKSLKGVNVQIESTQAALTKARRGDYSGAASSATARLKAVQKEIAAKDKALKAARRGDFQSAALAQGTKAYNAYVAKGVSQLEAYANKSDTLTKKLKSANAALTDAIKVRDDYRTSMTEKFTGAYGLSDTSATTGIETIIRGFQNAATTVTTFSKQLAVLKSRGLSTGLIDQVAQLGSESGSKVATNLLTGTDSQIQQITKQYNALNQASASSGKSLSDQMHKSGVDTAAGYVNGLNGQLSAVTKASEKLADSVVSTVRKKLGIHSPSRVMLADGLNTGQGFLNGIREKVPEVQRAMADLAAPVSAYAGDVGVSGVGGHGGVSITGGQFGYSPDEIAQAIRRDQRKQAALHIY